MTNLIRWARQAGLALVLGAAVAAPAMAAAPASRVARPSADVTVTEADVRESNEEIESAFRVLAGMWTSDFAQMGGRFVTPRLYNYRGNVRTQCGVMSAGNAAYCSMTNAIYFDEVFLARQRKEAARRLGTDGDMAGVGIIAHEMGHAAAIQLGVASRVPYTNEAIADCLAGTFARRAQEDGSLEEGDLEEALFGMALAGDPEVELTGNQRVDARRVARARVMAHGTSEQRMSNFKTGLDNGIQACLPRRETNVILSEARDLLVGQKQIPRFAQDDN